MTSCSVEDVSCLCVFNDLGLEHGIEHAWDLPLRMTFGLSHTPELPNPHTSLSIITVSSGHVSESAWMAGKGKRVGVRIVVDGDPDAGPWRAVYEPYWQAHGTGWGSAEVTLGTQNRVPVARALYLFLRFWISELIRLRGGLVVHAAAVRRPQGAVLLVAPSRGGKTTFVRTHGGNDVLGDDHAILVLRQGRFFVVPSPFPGREGTVAGAKEAPLWQIAALFKGAAPVVEDFPPSEAVGLLIRNSFMAFSSTQGRQRLLDRVVDLTIDSPVARLTSTLDLPPWQALEEWRDRADRVTEGTGGGI